MTLGCLLKYADDLSFTDRINVSIVVQYIRSPRRKENITVARVQAVIFLVLAWSIHKPRGALNGSFWFPKQEEQNDAKIREKKAFISILLRTREIKRSDKKERKMSVIDILFRLDDISKKYEKYDVEKQRDLNPHGDDAFARLYSALETEIDKAFRKYEVASVEKNRAAAVAMNAEVRRAKARLKEEAPKLQKLARKKVKGLSKVEQEARYDMVLALSEKIEAIPDVTTTTAKSTGAWGTSASNQNIKFDSSDGNFDSAFCQQTEESSQFKQEYEMRKLKQDQGLDVISDGLDTLKSLALDMNEELDRQVPLMDEIDRKVDKATSDLKNTNVRLKQTLFKVRSSRNFCIDIILLSIILGIAFSIYNAVK